jgi:hypothetical protein
MTTGENPLMSNGPALPQNPLTPADDRERVRRWRLLLGSAADPDGPRLSPSDQAIDAALAALYDGDAGGQPGGRGSSARQFGRSAGLGASAPKVARWLGDIRTYFPSTVVQVMQRDAIDRLNLRQLLLEPEML